MLSKLKKKSESATVKVPGWHLDFRNTDRLPDVKPIRTAFFVNGVAVLVAAGVALNFANQELQLYGLRSQIAQWEEQIEQDRRPSSEAVKQFQTFKAEEKKIQEAAAFLKTNLQVSDFLLRLGTVLPDNISIDTIDWRGPTIILRGTVSGSPDEASGYASRFVETLNNDEVLAPIFDEVALTSLARNPSTGLLSLEVRLPFTSTP